MITITDVAGRIQQLQRLIDPSSAAAAGSTSTAGSNSTAGGSANGFAAALALARAQGTGAATAGATAGNATGQAVVADARRYLGVPYVWGGTDPKVGLDCSGLVQRVYSDLGIQLPRVAADQARAGRPVANLAAAQPGDVLAFGQPAYHIAIYIGNGQMIAAPQPGETVKVQPVYQTPSTIRRIVPDQPLSAGDTAGLAGGVTSAGWAAPDQAAAPLGSTPYAELFTQAAGRYGLSPALLAAVAKIESGYNPRAVSPAGAQGLMQLMPGTAAGLGVNPFDPAQAIDGAARMLSANLTSFGSVPLALAGYNAGAGAVRQYGGIPPYPETQAYVGNVQAAMAALGSGGSA